MLTFQQHTRQNRGLDKALETMLSVLSKVWDTVPALKTAPRVLLECQRREALVTIEPRTIILEFLDNNSVLLLWFCRGTIENQLINPRDEKIF